MSVYTRERSRSNLQQEQIRYYTNSPSGSVPDNGLYTVVTAGGDSKIILDCPHPGYRKAVKSGAIIMGDLNITTTTYGSSSSSFTCYDSPQWGIAQLDGPLAALGGEVMGSGAMGSVNTSGLAVNAAFAKMNAAPLMGGEIASDYKQTLSMLRKPFSGAADLTRKILSAKRRRLKLKSNLNDFTAFTGAWLEYRYGWKPLILDCESAIKSVGDYANTKINRRLVARSSHGYSGQFSQDFVKVGLGRWTMLSSSGVTIGSGKAVSHAGVIYEQKSVRNVPDAIVTNLGLQAKDVPATIWEVIPYSFVVDWFVGVGDWLQATTPNVNVSVLGSWGTTLLDWESRSNVTMHYPAVAPATTPTITNVGTYTVKVQSVIRTCGAGPTSIPPTKGMNLSVVQTVDALSLIGHQVIRGLRELKH